MGAGVGRKEGRPRGGANSAAKDRTWYFTKAQLEDRKSRT